TGLKRDQFCNICETAAKIWQELGYDKALYKDLLIKLRAYKHKEKLYTQMFNMERKSSLK
ncbi:22794_t:CDS:1, partial [Dentiscutata erythropus]